METETGKVRAIANLGRANDGLIMKQLIMLLQNLMNQDRLLN
jgi:hypothetical protein